MLVAGALTSAQSPASATPDVFLTQVTHAFGADSNGFDMSADGRFVVFESTGDVATLKPDQTALTKSPNNTDGNREVFLYDYAQRRIFQLTDTRSVLKATSPTPSPSPTATPTASPSPTPIDLSNVQIEISNVRPMLSLEPTLSSSGTRTYTIVFSSNAPNPASFNGVDPGPIADDGNRTLSADANTEIWTYQVPAVADVDLTTGADIPYQDLSGGTFSRVTRTPASRAPSAGSTTTVPFIADDNRDASITDDGGVIAFVSTRDLVTGGNVDTGAITPNPEIFILNRGTAGLIQVTNTKWTNPRLPAIFNENPCLAGSGSAYTLAFTSNADLIPPTNDDGGGLNNAEVFTATYNGATIVNNSLKQVTKTKNDTVTQQGAVAFTLGRRLSRDGRWIGFESLATDPKANATATSQFLVTFVYDTVTDSFTQVGPRAVDGPDVGHFPTFTNYSGTTPGAVVFTSRLNFKSDGTFPAADQSPTGLNPGTISQVFLTPLNPASAPPVQATGPFTRLTNIGTTVLAPIQALMSASSRRFAFSIGGGEFGGGNSDRSAELFYQLTPPATTASTGTVSLFTGASLIPVAVPAPSGSPAPSPSPTGSPGPLTAPGLAAGEVAVMTSGTSLAPSSATTLNASESHNAPSLPIELNGVSVSINGLACGLHSVAPGIIKFVLPPAIAANTGSASYPLVINNNGTVIRGLLVIVAAQPDIETLSNGPNGRAVICNITVPGSGCIIEPFNVTTPNASGSPVPTILEVHLTGVRGTPAASITVTIGTTGITASNNIVSDLPGSDLVVITLPSTVDRGDNLPVVVRVGSATSRPTPGDAPPLTKINPSASPSPSP
jgi:uncharacterized protein (TIGR03437 family)